MSLELIKIELTICIIYKHSKHSKHNKLNKLNNLINIIRESSYQKSFGNPSPNYTYMRQQKDTRDQEQKKL